MPARSLPRRILAHVRGQAVGYLAVFLALGGGYALAAAHTTTIHGCVVKQSGALVIKAKCGRGQTKLLFNQTGPQGVQGKTGQTGPQGPAAPNAWALVGTNGPANSLASNGISSTLESTGTYQITVTAPACAGKPNDPEVAVSDSNPPGGQLAGAFPVAWVALGADPSQFTVYTGDVANGSFALQDHTFSLQDVCGS